MMGLARSCAGKEPGATMKVLYHVDERERWGMLLGNVANMLAYAKEQGTPLSLIHI